MSYKSDFAANNTDLQTILDTVNALEGGSTVESTFTPTDSGGTTYKSKFDDNNADLRKVLETVNSLPAAKQLATVTITGSGIYSGYATTLASVTVDGVAYTSAATVEVEVGSVIELMAFTNNSSMAGGNTKIVVDGTTVATGSTGKATYQLEVTGNTSIALNTGYFDFVSTYYGTITVTTSGGGNLISFTIHGTVCSAEDGMTWYEWWKSSYFPSGWGVDYADNYLYIYDGTSTSYVVVTSDSVIVDGWNYDQGAPPTLISFTIDGTTYQAEEGMTWAGWCESSYNTVGAYFDDADWEIEVYGVGIVYNSSSNLQVDPDAAIVSGGAYYIS